MVGFTNPLKPGGIAQYNSQHTRIFNRSNSEVSHEEGKEWDTPKTIIIHGYYYHNG